MGNWDLADMMNMQTLNNLANIPNEVRQNQYVDELFKCIEEQNDSIERQNQYIRDMQAQYDDLKSKFYELMDARDEWQAREESTIDTVRDFIDSGLLNRDEFNTKRKAILKKKRVEVPLRNGTPC
jgi:hypothetical protein